MLDSQTCAYTLISFAGTFQDFYSEDAKDVTFKYMDEDGVTHEELVPNVTKLAEQLSAAGVTDAELVIALNDYYTKTEIDQLFEEFEGGDDPLGATIGMNVSTFKSIANSKQLASGGVGFVHTGKKDSDNVTDGISIVNNRIQIGNSGVTTKVRVQGIDIKLNCTGDSVENLLPVIPRREGVIPAALDITADERKRALFFVTGEVVGGRPVSNAKYRKGDRVLGLNTFYKALVDDDVGGVFLDSEASYERLPYPTLSADLLVFMEVWHEKVATTGFVYPFGNVQYLGGDVDLNDNIEVGSFTGADTYSLFNHKLQAAGDTIGKGYVWDDMEIAGKGTFLANPDNNLYSSNGELYQVRNRIRTVQLSQSGVEEGDSEFWYHNSLTDEFTSVTAQGKSVTAFNSATEPTSLFKKLSGIEDREAGLIEVVAGIDKSASLSLFTDIDSLYAIPILITQIKA